MTDAPIEALTLDPVLLPSTVVARALRIVREDEDALRALGDVPIPDALANAVLKRRVEFAAGRRCVREALAVCDPSRANDAIGVGTQREPIWPAGIVGAIAHTRGYVAAAVARSESMRGVGLDVERWMDANAPGRIGSKIVAAEESRALVAQTGWPAQEVLTVAFSAKESVYKCLFPEVQRYFGFHDAWVERIDAARGTFEVRLVTTLTEGLRTGLVLEGRFSRMADVVFTALALSR
jgi:4'-phosphopantetheinyl transferase EntD